MAKRFSTNRRRRPRPPGLTWTGDGKRPDVQAERTRLTLYITNRHLDLAEELCRREGVSTIQLYCEALLEEALEAERSRHQIDETESRRGPLVGLREIAADPEYLAEWNASTAAANQADPNPGEEIVVDVVTRHPVSPRSPSVPTRATSDAARSLLRHVHEADDDSFLGRMRRGENPTPNAVAELVESLATLDGELAGAPQLDRSLAYALHRLAFESQVLLTDAWPGAFDAGSVHTCRAIQEAVDRILSGQDIRYLES